MLSLLIMTYVFKAGEFVLVWLIARKVGAI